MPASNDGEEHSYQVGISVGLKRAGDHVKEKALTAFGCRQDELAKALRALADQLHKRGKQAHPGPTPGVPETIRP